LLVLSGTTPAQLHGGADVGVILVDVARQLIGEKELVRGAGRQGQPRPPAENDHARLIQLVPVPLRCTAFAMKL